MRTARAIHVGLGLALALAPGLARAEPPRVAARLEYTRGKGGEACPAEPTVLRADVRKLMGYDPFERSDAPDRLAVLVTIQGRRGFAALVERFNASGERTWSETFPPNETTYSDCAALFSPLASYLDGLFLTFKGTPAPLPAAALSEPAAPAPSVPPSAPAPAPAAQAVSPPELPDVPNPARNTARNVAIVSYAAAGAFLGLGIAWSVYAQSKANSAQALTGQPNPVSSDSGCQSASAPGRYCDGLLAAWQSRDAALNLRNGWFAAAGVSVGVGAVATAWALNLPTMIKGQPKSQISVRPGGLVFFGAF